MGDYGMAVLPGLNGGGADAAEGDQHNMNVHISQYTVTTVQHMIWCEKYCSMLQILQYVYCRILQWKHSEKSADYWQLRTK